MRVNGCGLAHKPGHNLAHKRWAGFLDQTY
jgi:hypothetical protein